MPSPMAEGVGSQVGERALDKGGNFFHFGSFSSKVLKRSYKIYQEDAKVVELVKKFGAKRWSVIAQELPGRIGKQCRER